MKYNICVTYLTMLMVSCGFYDGSVDEEVDEEVIPGVTKVTEATDKSGSSNPARGMRGAADYTVIK